MRRALLLILVGLCGCSTEPPLARMEIAFQRHDLMCAITGLQAKMQITGADDCPLDVNADRTVQGVCLAVPTGEIRQFRLVYFVLLAPDQPEVDLAYALVEKDLRNWTQSQLKLSFPAEAINTQIDEDNDGKTNLEEVCAGSNPRGP